MNLKKLAAISILTAALTASSSGLFAIGEISVGANMGATRDLNNMGKEIFAYNVLMETYKEENPDASVSQIPQSPNFVWGFNFKYQFNFILFRLGTQFSRTSQKYRGNIETPAGGENEIKITAYQNSYPFSIAFLVPFKERTFFYLGGGVNYHTAYVKITQSDPVETDGILPDSLRRKRYTGDFAGYHFIAGGQAPIPFTKNFTISAEWIHQEGRSYPLSNGGIDQDGNTVYKPKRTISVKGDFILFGVNYHINL